MNTNKSKISIWISIFIGALLVFSAHANADGDSGYVENQSDEYRAVWSFMADHQLGEGKIDYMDSLKSLHKSIKVISEVKNELAEWEDLPVAKVKEFENTLASWIFNFTGLSQIIMQLENSEDRNNKILNEFFKLSMRAIEISASKDKELMSSLIRERQLEISSLLSKEYGAIDNFMIGKLDYGGFVQKFSGWTFAGVAGLGAVISSALYPDGGTGILWQSSAAASLAFALNAVLNQLNTAKYIRWHKLNAEASGLQAILKKISPCEALLEPVDRAI